MTLAAAERLIHQTTSLCLHCKNAVPARVVALPDATVWMRKVCDRHGAQEVRLSDDATWYEETRAIKSPLAPPRHGPEPERGMKGVERGCPFDCGPCEAHEQKVRLPVVTITSACNLDCPICYVHNKNEDAFHMGVEQFARILDHLVADHGGELDIVNFTGGEPTLHPHFLDFVEMAHHAGIHRVTICSNGVRLAKEESLVKRLGELGGRVALSFDTFDAKADVTLQGASLLETKLKCLDLLEKHDVDTTLIPVMTRGINDHEIGRIIALALSKPNIRHMEIHTMTYTGQGGESFDRAGRISMREVLQRIEETTGGMLRIGDFVPSPCAHPLCYQVAYLLLDPDGGPPVPFSRFLGKQAMYECLSERLYLEPSPRLERELRGAIDRLWADEDGGEDAERILRLLRGLLTSMFPSGRSLTRKEAMRIGERASKAIYVHSHMDQETFDTERVAQCCDSNCYADGTTIPVCSYNVLYREKETHFNLEPRTWNERSGGQRFPALPVLRGN